MSTLACDREFTILIDGEERRLVVEWMVPVRERGAWRCDLVIHWPDRDPERSYAVGLDSTQAMLLGMQHVLARLTVPPHDVYWLDRVKDLGLPPLPPHSHEEVSP